MTGMVFKLAAPRADRNRLRAKHWQLTAAGLSG